MNVKKEGDKSIDNVLIRIIGIPLIGIVMPVIFYPNPDFQGLLKWIIISMFLTFIAWEISRRVVSFLWKKFPWEINTTLHILMITLFLTLLTIMLGAIIYYINYLFIDVADNYWIRMKGAHLSIILLTFFTTSVYEGAFLFYNWKKTLLRSTLLEKENIQSQFETLKNQVNPHFLFNCLNALSAIIPENPEIAVEFVNRFSSIYRYVLEVKDLNSVELNEELDFVKSYIYLQKIRYGENLQVQFNIDKPSLSSRIMPLSLQVLVENAIKHNEISEKYPLTIDLTIENNYLVVKNNLHKINRTLDTPKTGLKNLVGRYRLITGSKLYFHEGDNEFISGIPLLTD